MTASKGIGKGYKNRYRFGDIPLRTSRLYTWPDDIDRDLFRQRITNAAWMHGRNKKVAMRVLTVSVGVKVRRLG